MAYSHELRFVDKNAYTNLTYYVHRGRTWAKLSRGAVSGRWTDALTYSPPLPRYVPGKGIPCLAVTTPVLEFLFFSEPELNLFCAIYPLKILPRPRELALFRDLSDVNQIWLSQIPKPDLKTRIRIVSYIRANDAPFRKLVSGLVSK